MKKITLDGNWLLFKIKDADLNAAGAIPKTVSQLQGIGLSPVTAFVPGNYELDFEENRSSDRIFFGTNIIKLQEQEDLHLFYCRKFSTEGIDQSNAQLVFEGIDTVAEIYLNSELLADPKNMLLEHILDVSGRLQDENELVVHILPVFIEAEKHIHDAGPYSCLHYNLASLHIRKAPHMFGWDIMPRALSGGIWRSVRLLEKPNSAIEDCYIYTVTACEGNACVNMYYRVKYEGNIKDYTLKLTGRCKDSVYNATIKLWHTEGLHKFTIENPYLWWPKNMGDPDLYDFTLELWRGESLVDTKELKIGIRTVKLERTSLTNENGCGAFQFCVNGRKMFVMGTNWVPLDAFPSRDRERLPKALEMLDDIGVNMVRCWGGNVYEDHEFFDFCDSHGIAVWQDFAFGCAIYPQDDAFLNEVKTEVASVVRKLRNHSSIFLWAGDNEVDIAYATWSAVSYDPNRNKVTRQAIPDVLQMLDPVRPYLPSSPYIDETAFQSKQFDMLPEDHLWGPRDYYKGDYYCNSAAHFASEIGYHGCVSPESVEKFISRDKIWPPENNDEWLAHATCMELKSDAEYAYRIPLMINQVRVLFGQVPDNFRDFALASQISQAEADKFFIERFRLSKWRRTGIIWWNLIDGWPQFSDAIVDYYYSKKVAYDYIKRSQQSLCLMFSEPENGTISLYGANELNLKQDITYTVTDLGNDKTVLSGTADLSANATEKIADLAVDDSFHFYLLEWILDGKRHCNHYVCGKPTYDLAEYIKLANKADLINPDGFNRT